MNILFLSQIVPYPPHGGVLQRGFNIIREISKTNDVHLLAFVHPDVLKSQAMIDESREVLDGMCTSVEFFSLWPKRSVFHKALALLAGGVYQGPFSSLAHYCPAFSQRVREIIDARPIDVAHFDTIGLARFREDAAGIPSIVTHHNIESRLMARRSKVERTAAGRWYVARQARLLQRYETMQSPKFAMNVVMSHTDEQELMRLTPAASTAIVPNGVDVDYFRPTGIGEEAAVIYTGGMNMFANLDAVMYFLRAVWPTVRKAVPGVKFYVIGQDAPKELLQKSEQDPSIIVTGYVDDVRPYVARSAVYVVPLRVGGGTRLKVLDALAQGKAIVSTSIGCEGIEVSNGVNICIENTDAVFAERVIELLHNDEKRRQLGTAARELAEERYSWTGIGQVLQDVYTEVAK